MQVGHVKHRVDPTAAVEVSQWKMHISQSENSYKSAIFNHRVFESDSRSRSVSKKYPKLFLKK